MDDVKLCARRNDSLVREIFLLIHPLFLYYYYYISIQHETISDEAEKLGAEKTTAKAAKASTSAAPKKKQKVDSTA